VEAHRSPAAPDRPGAQGENVRVDMRHLTPEGVRVVAEPAPRSAAEPLRSNMVEDGGGTPAGQVSEAPPPSVDHATWRTSEPLPQAPRALIDPAKFTHYAFGGSCINPQEAVNDDVRTVG
jgi:hypothetical protein